MEAKPPGSDLASCEIPRIIGGRGDVNRESNPFMLRTQRRRSDQVVDKIRDLVLSGQLGPGDRLPPELVLAEQMGVSRTGLREGMRLLEAQGLLETRPGVGTVVREAGATQVVRPLEWLAEASYGGLSFDEFHTIRRILETEIAALAATNATDEGIVTLEAAMADMETSVDDNVRFAEHDAAFHHGLAAMTGNRLLELLIAVIRELLERHIESVLAHIDPRSDVIPYHAAILEAVKARDPEAARRAMKAHLHQVRTNFEAATADGVGPPARKQEDAR